MQRYTVTVVSQGDPSQRPTLLIPFAPTALVTAFIDELYKRIAKHGLQLAPKTHLATLHLECEGGAIIDCEDVLSDVVVDPKNDKLFATFAARTADGGSSNPAQTVETSPDADRSATDGQSISVRVITPTSAKNRDQQPSFKIPVSATLRELHKTVAQHLNLPNAKTGEVHSNECNCRLARQIAELPSSASQFLVVHDKSEIQRFDLSFPARALSIVSFVGNSYKKTPVAAVCSKHRHVPAHARSTDVDEALMQKSRVLDLHVSEVPLHPACMRSTITTTGLHALAVDGVLEIYAVDRLVAADSGSSTTGVGKGAIYRAKAHWQPPTSQSERGMAMFLSSLHVFASLVQDVSANEVAQDAVLHVFDLMCKFPPALRTLHILITGKTPTAVESAALSHACFSILDDFMPTTIIGTDHFRVLEGSRLLFGFILEKARTLKLEAGAESPPYLSAFTQLDLQDCKTGEAVMQAVQTRDGLLEVALYNSFQEGCLLAGTHLQSSTVKDDIDATLERVALLTGGMRPDTLVFCAARLAAKYQYEDQGNVDAAIDLAELSELNHLAELCGRNKLAVHKPSQLDSAVAPALTFDREAHLAVYTGNAPCSVPGQSSMQFRPSHGEETIDPSVIEQLIAPLLRAYEANGTAVFDSLGGAAIRKLQAPDECIMFVVDCSASMRGETDFHDVDDDAPTFTNEPTIESIVDTDFYNRASFDELKDMLREHEGFDDMIAIVSEASDCTKRSMAVRVIQILRSMLASGALATHKDIEKRHDRAARQYYYMRQEIMGLERALAKMKTFWAGHKSHEEAICDFLLFRASTIATASQRWTWSIGDAEPSSSPPPHNIPTLSAVIMAVPDNLWCPISHSLMEDAVTAVDNVTYSRSAISKWYQIRKSSPMHGVPIDDVSLNDNEDVAREVESFINGTSDELVATNSEPPHKRRKSASGSAVIQMKFESSVGSFERLVPGTSTITDVYKLAFRGLKARHLVFQLAHNGSSLRPSADMISSKTTGDKVIIAIRIADDEPVASGSAVPRPSETYCLIKVYEDTSNMLFAFWIKRSTSQTMITILWKYWRYHLCIWGTHPRSEQQVWTDMSDSGDNLLTGRPQSNTEPIAHFLNSVHCFGHLGEEKVYREQARDARSTGILVLKVKMNTPYKSKDRTQHKLTRLDVLKQMFEALINRMLAYGYKTHVGLVGVGTTARIVSPISHVLENFRKATSDMHAQGDTALWDSLALARDQLVEYASRYPAATKRIIVISDGEDTKSTTNSSQEVCWRLRQNGVVVDSIALGNENNRELRTLSYILGSYRFQPTSLVNALAICEMEPFLSITERPPIQAPDGLPVQRISFLSRFWSMMHLAHPTVVSADSVPPRKAHPNLRDSFVLLTADTARRPTNTATSGLSSARQNLRTSRLMTEMRQVVANANPKYDVYCSESDYSFWKIVMNGPDESPYAEGTFVLYMSADETYPAFAPKARFITKIRHPNVNAHGRICHSIFDRDWTSDTSMTTLLDTVYGVLLQPELSDPVNTTTTLGFHHDQVEFADEVRDHVSRFATKTREQWRAELLGEVDGDADDDEGVDGVSAEDEDMDDSRAEFSEPGKE